MTTMKTTDAYSSKNVTTMITIEETSVGPHRIVSTGATRMMIDTTTEENLSSLKVKAYDEEDAFAEDGRRSSSKMSRHEDEYDRDDKIDDDLVAGVTTTKRRKTTAAGIYFLEV